MRTPHPHSALRRSPLAVAIALALLPAAAVAADANRLPTPTQAGPSTDGSGPFVVQGSAPMPLTPKVAGPSVFVSDDFLSFGNVQVGTGTRKLTTKLTSNGTTDYVISSFDNYYCGYGGYGGSVCYASADMACSTTCQVGVPYAPGTSCTITYAFTPDTVGSQYAYTYLCDNTNAFSYAHYISAQGFGYVPIVNMSPATSDFGTVRVGKASDVRTFFVSNPLQTPADIGEIQTVGPFLIVANSCTAPIAPFARCTVDVQFFPTEAGYFTGKLVVPSNAPVYYGAQAAPDGMMSKAALISYGGYGSGPAVSYLSGTGVEVATLDAPEALDVGTQVIGSPPVTAPLSITNSGDLPLALTGFATTPNFGVTSACPGILPVKTSCTLTVSFGAPQKGDYTGTLLISTDHGSKSVDLTGHTIPVPAPELRISPVTITFGDRVLGTQSAPQRVSVSNVGTAAAAINEITISTDFAIQGNNCGASLPAASSCGIDVVFRPIGFGQRQGQLTIVDSADGSPHKVNLGGNGCRVPNGMGNRAGTDPCSP